MDPEISRIIIYILLGGVIFFVLARYSSKPKKCTICGVNTKDEYEDEEGKSIALCRDHLIHRWKKDLIASKFDMIMIEPDLVRYPHAYLYATVGRLGEWEYPKSAQENVSSILDTIKGKNCQGCDTGATVAYYEKSEYSFPLLEELKPAKVYLCKNCAIRKIESSLRNAEKGFGEGLYAPTNDRGIYHVQEF